MTKRAILDAAHFARARSFNPSLELETFQAGATRMGPEFNDRLDAAMEASLAAAAEAAAPPERVRRLLAKMKSESSLVEWKMGDFQEAAEVIDALSTRAGLLPNGSDFAGLIDATHDEARTLAIVRDAYDWTLGPPKDGQCRLAGLVAGDMGWATTGITIPFSDIELLVSDELHADKALDAAESALTKVVEAWDTYMAESRVRDGVPSTLQAAMAEPLGMARGVLAAAAARTTPDETST